MTPHLRPLARYRRVRHQCITSWPVQSPRGGFLETFSPRPPRVARAGRVTVARTRFDADVECRAGSSPAPAPLRSGGVRAVLHGPRYRPSSRAPSSCCDLDRPRLGHVREPRREEGISHVSVVGDERRASIVPRVLVDEVLVKREVPVVTTPGEAPERVSPPGRPRVAGHMRNSWRW